MQMPTSGVEVPLLMLMRLALLKLATLRRLTEKSGEDAWTSRE